MTSSTCCICKSEMALVRGAPSGGDSIQIDCPHCGVFAVSRSLSATIDHVLAKDVDASQKLSHAVRRYQEGASRPMLTSTLAEAILQEPLPRPREQADLLLRWLATQASGPGEELSVEYGTHGAIIGASSQAGFSMVLGHLLDSRLVAGHRSQTIGGGDFASIALTFDGWDRFEEIKGSGRIYRRAFMAMKFGDSLLESVIETVFKPSAKLAGFDLRKVSDTPKAGLIDNRMRVEIQSSDFLIADLSHDNAGAYWEAGYAEGLGKPVIYTCEVSKFHTARTHFDTNHHLTVLWDPEQLNVCGAELAATIRATLPHLARLNDTD